MKRAILMLVAPTLLLSTAGHTRAGPVLPSHALVGGYTLAWRGVAGLPGETVRLEGNGSLDTGLFSDSHTPFPGGPVDSGEARAVAQLNSDSLLRAYSSALGEGTGLFDAAGKGQSVAAWRDVAFTNAPIQPNALRFNYSIDGRITSAANGGGGFHENSVGIQLFTSTDPTSFFEQAIDVSFPAEESPFFTGLVQNRLQIPSFWDSASFDSSGNFHGTFHFDSTYNSTFGGYGWGFALFATSSALGGTATADFLDTARLDSVTLTDGTPVSVTFDSGLQLGASVVPEPSSLVLFGIGGLSLTGFDWLRRRRKLQTNP